MNIARVGIVGADSTYMSPTQTQKALALTTKLLTDYMRRFDLVEFRSGRSPKKGIDVIAENVVDEMIKTKMNITKDANGIKDGGIFPPSHGHDHWGCSPDCMGFKKRNMLIGDNSDFLHDIVLESKQYCYHCNVDGHRRSGGCWTLKYFKQQHPATNGYLHII